MVAKGNPYDNALAESFFKTLKQEVGEELDKSAKPLSKFEYIST
ncbi:MAG: hypothetical protein KAX30_08180 [Candidatus Atribacteria bacterium]|nr:hypothetical protein [Candidatus Atribacteria bacterium]